MFERLVGTVIRFAERLLPIPVLNLVLLPAAIILATWELTFQNRCGLLLCRLYRLPGTLSPTGPFWIWRTCAGRVNLCMTRFLRFLPERLGDPCWQSRCRIEGFEHLQRASANGRPVVLVTLHYGNFPLLYHWLRSRGLHVAILAWANVHKLSPYRASLASIADRVNRVEGVPRIFPVSELWDVRDFLNRPASLLIVVADSAEGKKNVVGNGSGYSIQLATGAFRIAAMVGAAVIPCLISAPGGSRSTIHFGVAVPEQFLANPTGIPLACEHVIREIDRWIARHPEQCAYSLLDAVKPLMPVESTLIQNSRI